MPFKLIGIWGSPGAGKSTLSAAIAFALSRRNKNVLILNTDITVPALPVFLPDLKTTPNNSIGALLSRNINVDSLKSKLHEHPHSDRIAVMGLCSGETPVTYKSFERPKLMELLRTMDKLPIDFVITDCVSNPIYDQMTLLALEISDYVVRLVTPDIKGIEFEASILQWMRDSLNFDMSRHIRAASPVHSFSAVDEAAAVLGSFDTRLPFSEEVYAAFTAGKKLGQCHYKPGLTYDEVVESLLERMDIK